MKITIKMRLSFDKVKPCILEHWTNESGEDRKTEWFLVNIAALEKLIQKIERYDIIRKGA